MKRRRASMERPSYPAPRRTHVGIAEPLTNLHGPAPPPSAEECGHPIDHLGTVVPRPVAGILEAVGLTIAAERGGVGVGEARRDERVALAPQHERRAAQAVQVLSPGGEAGLRAPPGTGPGRPPPGPGRTPAPRRGRA